jgi:DNA-binding transcriptional ArsR family regulator
VEEDLIFKALANEKRRRVLEWLKDPSEGFPPQVDGNPLADGICSQFIAERLGVSQPTATVHLRLLVQAGLIEPKRIKQWTFYKRNHEAIRRLQNTLFQEL